MRLDVEGKIVVISKFMLLMLVMMGNRIWLTKVSHVLVAKAVMTTLLVLYNMK